MKKTTSLALASLAVIATLGLAGQATADDTGSLYMLVKDTLLTKPADERKPFFVADSGGVQKTVVLNRHAIAYKLLEQGYSDFSGFRANYEDFTVHAVNANGEAVLVHIHPTLGIVLGEESTN